jgi:hypothetical protein
VNYISPINYPFILVYNPKLLILGFSINQAVNLNYSRIFGSIINYKYIINTRRIKLFDRVSNITPINRGVFLFLFLVIKGSYKKIT